MFFINNFRILPLTIFAAALLVTLKVGALFDGSLMDDGPLQLSSADAQEAKKETIPEGKNGDAGLPQPGLADAKEGGGKEVQNASEGVVGKDGVEADGGFVTSDEDQGNQKVDPTFFSQSEIEVLQQLSERREKLEQMQGEIDTREGLLSAAEKRIDSKIADLRQLETTIKGLIKTHDEQQEAKIGSLVKIYEAMKPKDAARIFEQLQFDTILLVAERMKERKLAPVLAKMNANKAQEITVKLSKLRDLPPVGSVIEVR